MVMAWPRPWPRMWADLIGLDLLRHHVGACVSSTMSRSEIQQLPIEEKLRLMESLWEDLRDRFEQLPISPTQQALLDERRARVQGGTATLADWDAVKSAIGRG